MCRGRQRGAGCQAPAPPPWSIWTSKMALCAVTSAVSIKQGAAPPLWGLKERPHKRPGQGRQGQQAAPPGEGALAWSGFQAAQREGGLGPGRAAAWEGHGCCHRHARWSGQGCRDAASRARGRVPGLLRPPEPGQAWRPRWRRCVATRDTCWTSLRTQSPRHKQLVPRRGCEGPAEGTARQGPEGSPSRRPLRTCTSVPHLRGTGRVEPTAGAWARRGRQTQALAGP